MATTKKSKKNPLRQRAEKLLFEKSEAIQKIPAEDIEKLIHELQVHQVELEMQNEELRRAQSEIEESRSRYSDLYDFAPVGYFTFSVAGEIIQVNLTGAILLGIERSKMLRRTFSAFVAPDFQPLFRDHCFKVLRRKESERCELKLIKKDGTSFYASLESIAVSDGTQRWLRSIVIDITQRKKAEEDIRKLNRELEQRVIERTARLEAANKALSQSEVKFRILADNTYDWVFWVGPEGRPVFVSPSSKRITGRHASEFMEGPQLLRKIVHPEDLSVFDRHRKEEEEQERISQELHFRIIHTDRSLRWIGHVCERIYDEGGRFLGIRGSNRDITKRKQAEEASEKSKERLELLSETATKLLATDWPQEIVNELCLRVMTHLDCQAFFNFLVDEEKGRLHLNAWGGVSEEIAKKMEWLDYGEAVCGCAARDATGIVAENIPETRDPRTDLVRSFGIKAYACHPLFSVGRVIGTLSFGTRTRPSFTEDELSLMKTVTDQVAVAMEKTRLMEALRKSRYELEARVQKRTEELRKANEHLQAEIAERRRTEEALKKMAHDLHDRVKEMNCLYSISSHLENRHLPLEEILGNIVNIVPSGWQYPEIACARIILGDKEYQTENFRETPWRQASDIIADEGIGRLDVFYLEERPDCDEGPFLKEERGLINAIAATIGEMVGHRRADEERFRLAAAVEQSGESIVITDTEGKIIYSNEVFQESAGCGLQDVLGRDYYGFFTGAKEDEEVKERILETLSRGETWSGRLKRGKGSTLRELDVILSPMRDSSNQITNFLVTERDVTEETVLQQHLRQWQKMEALGTLAGGIAHDFNNILMPIMINTEMALFDVAETSPAWQYLQTVIEASKRGKELVRQIVTFSRQKEQEHKTMQVAPLVKEALKFLRASLPTSIEIRENIFAESALASTDPTQIHQVLMNLCSNAAYAMREQGGVLDVGLVSVEVDASMAAQFPNLKPGAYLKLTVKDTGCGMDREVMERIFEPFFTTKKPGEGAGMGLAVVHGIVKSHGGYVFAESELGKGSMFQVFLPKIQGEVEDESLSREPVQRGSEQILLVEDEEVLGRSEQVMLEKLGYKVVRKKDGLEALETFKAQPEAFGLIITDQTMPKMTGIRLSEELRRIRPDIPIILCTGFSESVDEGSARAAGIQEFLMKPVSVGDFSAAVRRVLDAPSLSPAF